MNEPTIYIIDDDESARKGISRLLNAAGYQTSSFSSSKEFLALQQYESPSCIVLDVRMPGMTGPELQEVLGERDYMIPIVFLSGHGDVPTAARAMKKGAVDFLTKPLDGGDLIEAVNNALSKDIQDRQQHEEDSIWQARIDALTPREFNIMTYVISGMLNKQIAAELGISEETVKIHRGRVMHKLDIVSVAELVRICEQLKIAPAKTRPPH
jgi:FixJ family two-component response regulator